MVQVKKDEVRQAVLRSAYALFRRKGYAATTTAQIARGARISESNLYVYFRSKLDILFAIYGPWLQSRMRRLEARLRRQADPRRRLRTILAGLWNELPGDDNGFSNNLMQALSTAARREGYRPDLLRWVEEWIEGAVLESLPPERRRVLEGRGLSHLLVMAQDGFVMNFHLHPSRPCKPATIELFCDLLLGTEPRGRRAAAGGGKGK